MTDNVRPGELADGDVLNTVEHLHGDLKAAGLILGQVDLRNVAGDDDLGAEADTGEEHFHLLAGGVLRLIENNEAIVQSSAAHIGKRCDLDIAALKIFLIGIGAEHIKQRVIQRAQVRVDLALKVAGQKAEAFPRFDGGTGEDDAVDLLGTESGDGGGNGEIGLAGTGGADAEGDGVFRDSIALRFLAKRLWLDGLALGGDADDVPGKLVYLRLLSLGDELEDIADVLRVDILTLRGKGEKTVDGLFGEHDALLLAADMDHIITVKHLDAQFIFNNAQVLVKGTEHADDMLHPFDFYGFVYHLFPFIPLVN